MALEDDIRSAVAVHLKVEPDQLQEDTLFGDDLCVDSLAAAELLLVLEDKLDISLAEDALVGPEKATYGDLVRAVKQSGQPLPSL